MVSEIPSLKTAQVGRPGKAAPLLSFLGIPHSGGSRRLLIILRPWVRNVPSFGTCPGGDTLYLSRTGVLYFESTCVEVPVELKGVDPFVRILGRSSVHMPRVVPAELNRPEAVTRVVNGCACSQVQGLGCRRAMRNGIPWPHIPRCTG